MTFSVEWDRVDRLLAIRSWGRSIVICLLVAPVGGCANAHFDDMRRKIDDLKMPASYRQGGELETGTIPAFFADSPALRRGYLAPNDLETTCSELQEILAERDPRWVTLEDRCIAHFRMSPGLRAASAVSYTVTVTAERRPDVSGTSVLISVSE